MLYFCNIKVLKLKEKLKFQKTKPIYLYLPKHEVTVSRMNLIKCVLDNPPSVVSDTSHRFRHVRLQTCHILVRDASVDWALLLVM